jgi:hypothetical protein
MLRSLVEQHAVAGNRKADVPPALVADLRDDDRAFAAQLKALRIERLRHERAFVNE